MGPRRGRNSQLARMVYIEVWDDFFSAAHQIYLGAPSQTRYSIKYRNTPGRLVLKVTDNKTCIKYCTTQKDHLKELERLNGLFFRLMTSQHPETVSAVCDVAAAAPPESASAVAVSEKARKKKSRK